LRKKAAREMFFRPAIAYFKKQAYIQFSVHFIELWKQK
jgi:hypothetical protein